MNKYKIMKSRLVILFTLIFLLGVFSTTLTALAEKFETFSVPKECMEQVRKEGNKLYMYDWAEWWPEEIYEGFSKEFGIQIVRDNYASAEEMVTKFKLHPEAKYDLVIAGTREFLQLKELGVLQKINHNWIPNVNKYLPERTKKAWYDPGYQYSVATDLYFVGYAYNTKYVDENDPRIPHWDMLFEGKEYAGRITMLDNMYEVIGSALKYLGFSYTSDDEKELAMAREVLLRQKPWVVAYDSWPKRLVLEEEAWIAHIWVGDAYFLHQELPAIKGALPPEGTLMGVDSLVIPKGATHPAAAHLFINYLFRPEVNALLIKTIGYAPNHTVAGKLLPEEMKKWPGVSPSEEFLDRCEFTNPRAYTGKGKKLRMKIWEELKR